MATPVKNEIGNTYGLLTVVRRAKENSKENQARWECTCACGGTKTTRGITLRRGHCISCGCEQRSSIKSEHRTNRDNVTGEKRYMAGNDAWEALGETKHVTE